MRNKNDLTTPNPGSWDAFFSETAATVYNYWTVTYITPLDRNASLDFLRQIAPTAKTIDDELFDNAMVASSAVPNKAVADQVMELWRSAEKTKSNRYIPPKFDWDTSCHWLLQHRILAGSLRFLRHPSSWTARFVLYNALQLECLSPGSVRICRDEEASLRFDPTGEMRFSQLLALFVKNQDSSNAIPLANLVTHFRSQFLHLTANRFISGERIPRYLR